VSPSNTASVGLVITDAVTTFPEIAFALPLIPKLSPDANKTTAIALRMKVFIISPI
jgi:hypothetical protein